MKKLFISCPMKGRTEENIRKSMERMHKLAEIIFDEELEVIPSYIEDNPPENSQQAVWYLGKSIQLMAEADYVIGIEYSDIFKGCNVEMEVARWYGIKNFSVCAREFMLDIAEVERKFWQDCEKSCSPMPCQKGEKTMIFKVMLDENAKMPTKAHETDAGFDLYAPKRVVVHRNDSAVIDTGVHIEIPKGYVGFLKSKSGLNVKHGITGEGVIDAGYTGSIVAKLYNNGNETVYFEAGQKIIQIVFLPIPYVELSLTDCLCVSERGNNGFGSSGKF